MVKTVSLGKIDGYNNGRKSCECTIEFGFREFKNQEPYFTAVANVWNHQHTDIIRGGQCLDYFNEVDSLRRNKIFNEVYPIWKEYHLVHISEIPETIKNKVTELLESIDSKSFKN